MHKQFLGVLRLQRSGPHVGQLVLVLVRPCIRKPPVYVAWRAVLPEASGNFKVIRDKLMHRVVRVVGLPALERDEGVDGLRHLLQLPGVLEVVIVAGHLFDLQPDVSSPFVASDSEAVVICKTVDDCQHEPELTLLEQCEDVIVVCLDFLGRVLHVRHNNSECLLTALDPEQQLGLLKLIVMVVVRDRCE